MSNQHTKLYFLAVIVCILSTACSASKPAVQTAVTVAPKSVEISEEVLAEIEKVSQEIPESEPYAVHTDWPAILPDGSYPLTANVVSGVEEDQPFGTEGKLIDMVWSETKGYVDAGMDAIYDAMTTGDVIAPLHMAKEYLISDQEQNEGLTKFKLSTSFRVVVRIDLEFTWNIQEVKINDEIVGYDIHVEKSGGSKYLNRMDHKIAFRKIHAGLSRFEMRSEVQAAMNKSQETEQYVVELYSRILDHVHEYTANSSRNDSQNIEDSSNSLNQNINNSL